MPARFYIGSDLGNAASAVIGKSPSLSGVGEIQRLEDDGVRV